MGKPRFLGRGWSRSGCFVRLQPDTLDTEYIYSRLAHTPKAERMWAQCRTTFLFKDYDVRSVIGRVGKIYLVPSAWSNLSFSTAQYVKQTPRDLEKSVTLEAAMRQKAAEAERNDAKADRNKDLLREALTEGGEKGLVQRELF